MLAGMLLLGAMAIPFGESLAQQVPSVLGLEIVPGETTTAVIKLSASVEGAAIGSFLLSDPERLVVEIPEAVLASEELELAGLDDLITRVETETLEDEAGSLLRISLYLARPADHLLSTEGSRISISFSERQGAEGESYDSGWTASTSDVTRKLSGPHLPAHSPPTVSTLDFQSEETFSRVIIGLNADSDYSVSKPEPRLVVVDLPNANLAASLERPLDASHFISPVRMVRAYRTREGTRVAINLRRNTGYEIKKGAGHLLYVDVEVPSDMQADRELARQGFTSAAPSTPSGDGVLRGAHQEELLIGATGRTVKPNDVFGTGGGANDPAALFGMSAGFMFDSASASSMPFSGQRINLDLVNADIHSVFRLISHVSKLNIVSGDDVSGRITVRLENVPWDQAFGAILQAKGLGSQRFGNIVRIAPIETIKSEQQAALEAKLSAEKLEDLQVYVVPLNFAQATDLKAQIEAVLSERGKLEIDKRSNQLIIQDVEKVLASVRELIRKLDQQNPQVLIESRIVEASSSFSRGLGIQWGSELNASASTGYSTGAFFPSNIGVSGGLSTNGASQWYSAGQDNVLADLGSPLGETSALTMHMGSIPGLIDLDVRLGAMESEGWGKVISAPRIVTLDNQEASIKQGTKLPYLSTSAGGTQVKFVDAALKLNVTPHITSEDEIFIVVDLTNNRADFSKTVQGQPAIQIKEASTGLLVDDGETSVIGGVFATENAESFDRVPLLSKIPLIGYLFKNSGQSVTRNELLVFITPRILSTQVAAND